MSHTPLHARLMVLGAALLFSTGGAAIKGTALTAWQVAGTRSLIAALALTIVLPEARRHWRARNWLVGLVYALTLVTFVTANKLTTAANAIFLQATAPLYILLVAPWALGERVRSGDVVFMAAMATGLGLFFVGEQPVAHTAPNPVAGNIIGTLSGIVWAFTVMGLRWVGSRDPQATLNTVVAGNLWAAVICLPWAWPMTGVTTMDWAVLLWLGVFQIGLAYVLLSKGVAQVTALEASLLLLAEPVLNPIWAWLVHGESVTAWALAGGAIILAATAVRTARTSTSGRGIRGSELVPDSKRGPRQ
jgi:drug/metabolite transporter, DME family